MSKYHKTLLLIAVCSLAALTGCSEKQTAEALILIRATMENPMENVFGEQQGYWEGEDYETFRQTQIALMKSPCVLTEALRDPEIASLRLIKKEAKPVAMLERNLIVEAVDDSEIVRVAMRGRDAKTMKRIVDAVRLG